MIIGLSETLYHLFPNAPKGDAYGNGADWVVRDDGFGQFIDKWHRDEPKPTEEEISSAKLELEEKADIKILAVNRDKALSELIHNFGDGRVIQCRPAPFIDESNMRNAIERMGRTGDKSCDWYAAGDTKVSITPAELQTVIESGQDQARVIWDAFLSETGA